MVRATLPFIMIEKKQLGPAGTASSTCFSQFHTVRLILSESCDAKLGTDIALASGERIKASALSHAPPLRVLLTESPLNLGRIFRKSK